MRKFALNMVASNFKALAVALCVLVATAAQAQVEIPKRPIKEITTFNIDGQRKSITMFGHSYSGIQISHVGPRGIGATLGLVPGDILLSINADPVYDAQQADDVLSHLKSGDLEIVFARQTGGTYKLTEKCVKFQNPLKDNITFHGGDIEASMKSQEELESDLLQLINQDRKDANRTLPDLQRSQKLSAFARRFAQDMVNRSYFNHIDPEGRNLEERARASGILIPIGENIANGMYDPLDAQALFMNEPDNNPHNHRGHILDPNNHYVGVGIAKAPDNTLIVVQEFTCQSPDQKGESGDAWRRPPQTEKAPEKGQENERDLNLDLPPGVKL
jgi:uncharacterized protein YkwD